MKLPDIHSRGVGNLEWASVSEHPDLREPSTSLGFSDAILFYRLFKDWSVDRMVAMRPDYHPTATHLPCRYEVLEDRWERLERTRVRRAVRTLRMMGLLPEVSCRHLARRLNGYEPDVVISLMEFQRYYAAAWRFSRFLGKPFVLMIHDDPDAFEEHARLADIWQSRRDRRIYQGAALRLSISEPMEDNFFKRYGMYGMVFYPIPTDDSLPKGEAPTRRV